MAENQVAGLYRLAEVEASAWDLDGMTDQLWHDLEGRVSLQMIRRVLTDVSLRYQDARVLTYVPIFVRRQAMEILLGSAKRPPAGHAAGSELASRTHQ